MAIEFPAEPTADETETTTDNAIEQAMVGPRRVSGETGSVESHSIPDLIAAKKHVAAQVGATSGFPIYMRQIVPPGA